MEEKKIDSTHKNFTNLLRLLEKTLDKIINDEDKSPNKTAATTLIQILKETDKQWKEHNQNKDVNPEKIKKCGEALTSESFNNARYRKNNDIISEEIKNAEIRLIILKKIKFAYKNAQGKGPHSRTAVGKYGFFRFGSRFKKALWDCIQSEESLLFFKIPSDLLLSRKNNNEETDLVINTIENYEDFLEKKLNEARNDYNYASGNKNEDYVWIRWLSKTFLDPEKNFLQIIFFPDKKNPPSEIFQNPHSLQNAQKETPWFSAKISKNEINKKEINTQEILQHAEEIYLPDVYHHSENMLKYLNIEGVNLTPQQITEIRDNHTLKLSDSQRKILFDHTSKNITNNKSVHTQHTQSEQYNSWSSDPNDYRMDTIKRF